uniref:Uncharacterized protein n=1 Tax=Vespula pensylvanica TaxID=30213 RepID=A0A834K4E2_VESPE|nr:hypothetical protein H0235_016633 [Vespula pensylvanica]
MQRGLTRSLNRKAMLSGGVSGVGWVVEGEKWVETRRDEGMREWSTSELQRNKEREKEREKLVGSFSFRGWKESEGLEG